MRWDLNSMLREIRERLEILRRGRSDSGEPDALVGAPLHPRPHFNSGAMAMDLPPTDTTDDIDPRPRQDLLRRNLPQ